MSQERWAAWQFVLGDWSGEGGEQPGVGAGCYTFFPDLDGQILVRRNRSEALPGAPRFRFECRQVDEQTVATKFEIAPPGQPENFSTYVEGLARQRQSANSSRLLRQEMDL